MPALTIYVWLNCETCGYLSANLYNGRCLECRTALSLWFTANRLATTLTAANKLARKER